MDIENTNQPQSPVQNPGQSQPLPSEEQPRQFKKFIIILVIIVALFAFGAGGYFLGTNKNQATSQYKQVTVSPTNIIQPSPTSTPTPIEDPIANWKIYISNKTGYSIRYPDSLKQSTSTYDGIGGVVTVDSWSPVSNAYSINIYSYSEGVNTKLEFNAKTESDESILVAGQNVRKLVGTEIVSDKGMLINVGPVKNKGQNYMLIYTSGSQKADSKDLTVFDQMLSTFKFAN